MKPHVVNELLSLASCRCFFIAQSYVLVKKWSEALVLYERVLKYAKEVQSKAKSLNNSLKVGLTCKQTHTHLKHESWHYSLWRPLFKASSLSRLPF